jgi:hypothetical protein
MVATGTVAADLEFAAASKGGRTEELRAKGVEWTHRRVVRLHLRCSFSCPCAPLSYLSDCLLGRMGMAQRLGPGQKNTYITRSYLGHAWGHGPTGPRPKSAPDTMYENLKNQSEFMVYFLLY